MSIKTKILLSVAIILSTAVTASAATKGGKIAIRHNVPARAAEPGVPQVSNPRFNPATTGGGSLGYNESMHTNDW